MHITTKVAGILGIIWATGNAVLAFGAGQPPALDASGSEITAYLSDHRGAFLAAACVFGATLPLLFVFAAALRNRLQDRNHSVVASVVAPAVATLGLGNALAYVALLPFMFGDGLGSDTSDGLVRYAYVLVFAVTMIANIGGATLIAAASTVQSPRARTASLVIAGLVTASCVGGLASPGLALVGGLGFVVIAIWAIAVGIGMLRTAVAAPDLTFSPV